MKLKQYVIFLVIYLIFDYVYLSITNRLHLNMVQNVQKSPLQLNHVSMVAYYLLAPMSYVWIVGPYATNLREVVKLSFSISSLMFGTFDLTNKTIFKDYTWQYTLMDIWYGIFAITTASVLTFMIMERDNK